MKDKNLLKSILPFKEGSKYNGYANNFCLKIDIQSSENIDISVFFPGFPDKPSKNNFDGCTRPEEMVGGGGEYNYLCKDPDEFINTRLIKDGIISGLKKSNNPHPFTIYVVRHGNSLHNKPMSLSEGKFDDQSKRLDSSLTPLGMFQADLLGKYFLKQGVFNSKNILFCSSFLQRTQLTGLLILKSAGVTLGEHLKTGLQKMTEQALERYKNTRIDISKFFGYSPIGKIVKDEKGKKTSIINDKFKNLFTTFVQPYGITIERQLQAPQGGKKNKIKNIKKTKKFKKSKKCKKTQKKYIKNKSKKIIYIYL